MRSGCRRAAQIAAVAAVGIQQAVGPVGAGAAVQRHAVDVLAVVRMAAVLGQRAEARARRQQVGRILGIDLDGAAEPAIAVDQVVRPLVDLDAPDQFGFDEDRALAVLLETLGRAIEDDFHVLGIAHAPDVQALPAGAGEPAIEMPGS